MFESQIFHKSNAYEYNVIRNNSNLFLFLLVNWNLKIETNTLWYNQDLIFKNEQLNSPLSMPQEIVK